MESNRLLKKVRSHQVALIAGNYESADMVDLIGSLGLFDGVWLDMEHSPVSLADLGDLSRASDLWGMSSLVRVPHNDPATIAITLDQGVDGVIVPHVSTRAAAEAVVDAARFGPVGHRGAAGGRKSYGRKNHYATANDETFVGVMIEDVQAIGNLEDILQVPHIDAFFVAQHDLAQSMGLLLDQANPRLRETIDAALRQVIAAGRVASAVVGPSELGKYLAMGVTLIKAPQWRDWIATGARGWAEQVRAARRETESQPAR